MTAPSTLVEVRALSKSYGRRRVLQGIDLDVLRGAVTAIIGPNGAGKTTLNKALLGLIHPDSGSIAFDGQSIAGRIEHRNRIGYMPQAARFPEGSCAGEVLALLDDLRGADSMRDHELFDAFSLSTFLGQPIRTLSGGQRQRLSAAAAFRYCPSLLLLDEPTSGLDPVSSGVLKDKIREVRAQGRAILITSHVLSELEELADTVVFLHEGAVRWCGPLEALLRDTGAATLERAIASLMQRGHASAS